MSVCCWKKIDYNEKAIAYVSLLLTASPSIQDLKTLLMKVAKRKKCKRSAFPKLIDGSVS